jgi:probable rRNA maturation factor
MKNSPLQKREGELAIDILIEADAWRILPDAEDIVRRAIACAATSGVEIRHPDPMVARLRGRLGWGLCVLLCDDESIGRLNRQWRGQDKPTNVLSFPAQPPPYPPPVGAGPDETISLGDIAIAYETLASEAEENGAAVSDHLSHLVVHGFLHLLGYDHHMDDEAERMERLERDILARIGVADPYAACDADI